MKLLYVPSSMPEEVAGKKDNEYQVLQWNKKNDVIPFTVTLSSHEIFDKVPNKASSASCISEGRIKFPAIYYCIELKKASIGTYEDANEQQQQPQQVYTIHRRFSQFKWLYEQYVVSSSNSRSKNKTSTTIKKNNNIKLSFPASRPFTAMSPLEEEKFIFKRQIELSKFINDLLSIDGSIEHPVVQLFFELDRLLPTTIPTTTTTTTTTTSTRPNQQPEEEHETTTSTEQPSSSQTSYFPFDVIVVTSPDNSAARAALAGTLQDVVKLLNNLYKEHTTTSTTTTSSSSSSSPNNQTTTNDDDEITTTGDNITNMNDSPSSSPSSGVPLSPTSYNELKRQWSTASTSINSVGSFDGATSSVSDALNEELDEDSEFLVSKSGILVLSTSDPYGARCGSGGGTLAALAYADAVYKRRRRKNSTNTASCSSSPSVLIIHAGGDSSRCPTQMALGKAWTSLPVYHPPSSSSITNTSKDNNDDAEHNLGTVEVSSPTLMILRLVKNIFNDLPYGSVVVTAGDCLISLNSSDNKELPKLSKLSETNGGGVVLGLAVPAPLSTAKNHGIFFVDNTASSTEDDDTNNKPKGVVQFLQKPTLEHLKEEVKNAGGQPTLDDAWIDTGVVVLLPKAARTFRSLGGGVSNSISDVKSSSSSENQNKPPAVLRACTRNGLEDMYQEYLLKEEDDEDDLLDVRTFGKQNALPVDLYSHIMLALPTTGNSNSSKENESTSDVNGNDKQRSIYLNDMKKSLKVIKDEQQERNILSQLYDILQTMTFQVICCTNGQFLHLGTTRELINMQVMGICNTSDAISTVEINKVEENIRQKCRNFGQSCYLVSRSHSYCSSSDAVTFVDNSAVVVNTLFDTSINTGNNYYYGATKTATDDSPKTSSSTSTDSYSNNIITVGTKCVFEHCHVRISSNDILDIGSNCLLSGLRGTLTTINAVNMKEQIIHDCNATVVNNNEYLQDRNNSASEVQDVNDTATTKNTERRNAIILSKMTLASGTMLQITKLKPMWRTLLDFSGPFINKDILKSNEHVICMLHVDDNIKGKYPNDVTIYGLTLEEFIKKNNLSIDDIWPKEDKVPENKRTLWNARLHPVIILDDGIDSIVPYDTTIGWISNLMLWKQINQQKQNGGDNNNNTDTILHVSSNVQKWKSMERLSLQQIRSVSDAFGEYSSRHELENYIKSKFDKSLSRITYVIKHRIQDIGCDVSPYIESFVGGDTKPLRKLWINFEKVIQTSTAKEKYDCSSRCFMIMSNLLIDLSNKLQQSIIAGDNSTAEDNDTVINKNDNTSDEHNIVQMIERIRSAPYQRSVMPYSNSVQGACIELSIAIKHILKSCFYWNPARAASSVIDKAISTWELSVLSQISTMKTCALYLEQGASALTEVCVCRSEVALKRVREVNQVEASTKWSVASSPGRIDIMGGWSDTPPISYEHGGSVIGMAVIVDNVKPISARCRLTSEHDGIKLVTEARRANDGKLINKDEVHIYKLRDLMDYRNPRSKACLLKAALICIGLVPRLYVLKDVQALEVLDESIQPFIDNFFNTSNLGMELVATSLLPKGSGMGGSSLLGGCVLAAISHCAGVNIVREKSILSVQEVDIEEEEEDEKQHNNNTDGGTNAKNATITSTSSKDNNTNNSNNESDPRDSLIYAVLMLEQLMTTGGGWQDQTNLIGGIKIARSKCNVIPLDLSIQPLNLSNEFISKLNKRLVLVYTGTPRLAKNLLQQVLRRWAKRTNEIIQTMNLLTAGAEDVAKMILNNNNNDNNDNDDCKIDQMGQYMLQYRTYKKYMIGSDEAAEPPPVTHLIDVLLKAKLIAGATILGAGGGGYLAMITSKEVKGDELHMLAEDVLVDDTYPQHPSILQSIACMTWHKCHLCTEGMNVFFDDTTTTEAETEHFSLDWHKTTK